SAEGGRRLIGAERSARRADQQPDQPTLLFMFAFLPQFVSPDRGSVAVQLLVLGLTQKATGLVVPGSVTLVPGAVGGLACQQARLPGLAAALHRPHHG